MAVQTELILVRHAEAVCNVAGIVGGEKGCTGLTDLGLRQAHRVARRLRVEHAVAPFGLFHATPRLRVRQTASAIAAAIDMSALVTADLREPDAGELDGRRWADVRQAFGGNLRRYPHRRQGSDSESWQEYLARTQRCLRGILDQGRGRRILVVGHRETIDAAHSLLLGLGPDAVQRTGFRSDHTGIARWWREVDPCGHAIWRLAVHNDTTHLTKLTGYEGDGR